MDSGADKQIVAKAGRVKRRLLESVNVFGVGGLLSFVTLGYLVTDARPLHL